ncbi:hypothetical protein [Streptomyces cavernae]|uniref:hypothetical protein n=1 Tax=Streptomyces cavernae TaxID=2259034 RepID=UPI000FEB89E5|nr:hypothetical protein [Streptomyces cavernae]
MARRHSAGGRRTNVLWAVAVMAVTLAWCFGIAEALDTPEPRPPAPTLPGTPKPASSSPSAKVGNAPADLFEFRNTRVRASEDGLLLSSTVELTELGERRGLSLKDARVLFTLDSGGDGGNAGEGDDDPKCEGKPGDGGHAECTLQLLGKDPVTHRLTVSVTSSAPVQVEEYPVKDIYSDLKGRTDRTR